MTVQGKTLTQKKKTKGLSIMGADRHVFNLLTVLGLVFTTLYLLGTSLPGWFVIEENVNTTSCETCKKYMSENHSLASKYGGFSKLYVTSSLWYLHLRLDGAGTSTSRFLPFVFLSKVDGEGSHVLCSGILGIITLTMLSLGVVFTISASTKPSKMIYYGLSQVTIVTAASTWMLVSFQTSQSYVTSVAREFCLEYVILSTSISLQILTGACAVLAFIMGCILIHLATILSSKNRFDNYAQIGDVGVEVREKMAEDEELIAI